MVTKIMRYGASLFAALMPVLAFANGADEESMMHQIEEMMPFEHLSHGHWFGGILNIVLWAGLIYAVVTLVRRKRGGDGGGTSGGGVQQ